MPELPDIVVYVESLDARIVGQRLRRVRLLSPFLLRTAVPPMADIDGKRVIGVQRLGKRIVIALETDLFLVLHLMIAGRLRWLEGGSKPPGRITLALFEFDHGTLAFTEAGSKRRASLQLVEGTAALAAFDMGGLEIAHADAATFRERLMTAHGKYGQPCPTCGAPIQRIVYAENETNYCARCQTGGTVLADRALSRLLKASWPRSINELG